MKRFVARLTKPDLFVFGFWLIVGALVSSDEEDNILLNLWAGFVLGLLFLGMFKWFKSGFYRL